MTEPRKLSPSDLTFLWDECRRCFYLKYVHGINRPSGAMPAIFGTIDRLMKAYFENRPTSDLDRALPPGRVSFGEKWVQSAPVDAGGGIPVYVRGKFDTVVSFDDGTYGVIDFKTSAPKPYHIPFYGRQLGAYAYALENPAPGKFALAPISVLGLLVVAPEAMELTPAGQIAYLGAVTWLEVPRDDAAFLAQLAEVSALLDQPEPPPPGEKCPYCQYRDGARLHGL